jgi:hypothetical protein
MLRLHPERTAQLLLCPALEHANDLFSLDSKSASTSKYLIGQNCMLIFRRVHTTLSLHLCRKGWLLGTTSNKHSLELPLSLLIAVDSAFNIPVIGDIFVSFITLNDSQSGCWPLLLPESVTVTVFLWVRRGLWCTCIM